jgi:hypothetical protein
VNTPGNNAAATFAYTNNQLFINTAGTAAVTTSNILNQTVNPLADETYSYDFTNGHSFYFNAISACG